MYNIAFKKVTKAFGETVVVNNMDFEVKEGERMILLGPSGCGKSTTLRIIAGLESITSGDLYMNGVRMNDIPCGRRGVSMVFQNYAIFPHMSVKENIIYGLKAAKMDRTEIGRRLKEVLSMLQLEPYADRRPRELSGGQRQRVALARAIVRRSNYFLLDEPLSNLDAQLRLHARKELVRIHEIYGQTMVYVTHDQVEAMTIGQRIALMHNGALAMLDTPQNVYDHPADVFCARFIGSPAMNIVRVVSVGSGICLGSNCINLPESWKKVVEKHRAKFYYAGIRPEHLSLTEEDGSGVIECDVVYCENYGGRCGIYVKPRGSKEEMIVLSDGPEPKPGDSVRVRLDFTRLHLFDADSEKNLGDPVF